jgi:hypothetical protein
MSGNIGYHWHDVDFRPCPYPGWRAVQFKLDAPGVWAWPLAGWLIRRNAPTS